MRAAICLDFPLAPDCPSLTPQTKSDDSGTLSTCHLGVVFRRQQNERPRLYRNPLLVITDLLHKRTVVCDCISQFDKTQTFQSWMMATEATAEQPVDVSGTDATLVSNLPRVSSLESSCHSMILCATSYWKTFGPFIACHRVHRMRSFMHLPLLPRNILPCSSPLTRLCFTTDAATFDRSRFSKWLRCYRIVKWAHPSRRDREQTDYRHCRIIWQFGRS